MNTEHKAIWKPGHADLGVSCSCGFRPKRKTILQNHVERKDPAGFAEWKKELWRMFPSFAKNLFA